MKNIDCDKVLLMLDQIPGYIAYVNATTLRYEFVNKAFEISFGIPRSKIVGMHIKDIIGESNFQFAQKYIAKVKTGESVSYDNTFNLSSGKRWIHVNYSPIFNDKGIVETIAVLGNDITAQKHSEATLRLNEETLRLVFNSMTDGVVIIDSKGQFSHCNSSALSILGLTKEQFLSHTPTDPGWKSYREDGTVFPFEEQPAIVAFKTGNKTSDVIVLDLPSGDRRWISVTATPFNVKNNGDDTEAIERSVLVTFANITERKLFEKTLLDSKRLLQSCIESPVGIVIMAIDRNYQYLCFNSTHQAAMKYAYGKDVAIGMNVLECIIIEDDRHKAKKNYDRAMAGESHSTIEIYGNINKTYFESFFNPIFNDSKDVIGITAYAIDITERKRAEEALQTSEAKFRAVAELAPMAIYSSIGIEQKATYVNEAFNKIFGYTTEDVPTVGHWWIKAFPDEEYRQQIKNLWTYNIEQSEMNHTDVAAVECVCTCKDGSVKNIVWVGKTIGDEFWAFGYDITERKNAETALRTNEEKQNAMISNTSDVIGIIGIDGTIKYKSPNIKKWFGWDPMELVGTDTWLTVHPDDLERIQTEFYELRKNDMAVKTFEYRYKCKNGNYKWIELTATNLVKNPVICGVLLNYHDITERKQSQDALVDSELKYSSLFKTMLEGVALHEIVCDANGKPVDYRFLDMNPAFEKLTGLKKNDVVGKTVLTILPATESTWIEKYGKVALTGEPISFENYTNALDRHYEVVAFCPKKNQFAVIFSDITERKKSDAAIAAEKERLSVTLRSIGDGVITTDISSNIVIMNKVAEELTGWKLQEVQGQPLSLVFNIINQNTREPHENPVEKVLSSGNIIELANHTLLVSRDGTERIIADSGAPIKDKESKTIGVVLVFRDMTDKHKMLDNLQRIDKLDSLSVLAGGIAHDFNNLLGGIFGYIDMAKELCTADKVASKYLDKALTVFERAKDLTQQLLTFSKDSTPKRKTGQIGELIKENAVFVLSGTNVSCDYQISDDLWLCDYDENQIGQVIDNVILNAQQAMPVGGTITISARNISIENPGALLLKPGDYIKVSVSDTGVGIPKNLLKRIFDPFFTTKQKGNGLGLATCYSIIEKHNGYIDVESVPGTGSTFHIYLPATLGGKLQNISPIQLKHHGKGCIIVMDDEDYMREIVGDMLSTMGYTPIGAKNGDEALIVCTESVRQGTLISGALFDLTIPGGMGGKETIVKFREKFPDIPVFAASGFSEDPVMARPTEFGFTDSIRKPFKKDELAEMLNKHLKAQKLNTGETERDETPAQE
jgi:PAS domain S-box-containing protein